MPRGHTSKPKNTVIFMTSDGQVSTTALDYSLHLCPVHPYGRSCCTQTLQSSPIREIRFALNTLPCIAISPRIAEATQPFSHTG
jgi:hypothetical protein